MEDVLEVYHRPYESDRPQVCLDETSKQLVAESRPSVAMRPGRCKRVDPEYRRCGVTSVFMLSEPLAGKRRVRVRSRRTQIDFAEVIRELCDELYPDAQKIILVLDNLMYILTRQYYYSPFFYMHLMPILYLPFRLYL